MHDRNLAPSLAIKARVDEASDSCVVANLEVFDVFADLLEEAEVMPCIAQLKAYEVVKKIFYVWMSYHIVHWSPPRQSRVLEPMERGRAWARGPSQSGHRCDRCRNTWDDSNLHKTSCNYVINAFKTYLMSMVTSSGPQVFLWMLNLVSFAPLEAAPTVSTDSISGIFYSALMKGMHRRVNRKKSAEVKSLEPIVARRRTKIKQGNAK